MRALIALSVVVMAPALGQNGAKDAALSCDQLQAEFGPLMSSSASVDASAQIAGDQVQAAVAAQVADVPPAEEGKKKGGGLFKKFGQAAGGLGGAFGGGRGAGAAVATAGAVSAATGALGGGSGDLGAAAGALGNLGALGGGGDKLASIGAATQMAGALSGGRGGGAGTVANAAVAANAMQGRGGVDAVAMQALATQQLGGAKVGSVNMPPRAIELFQQGQAKKCAWVPTEMGGAQK